MIIELTKDHKKEDGRIVKKGRKFSVSEGHPFKHFKKVNSKDEPNEEVNKEVLEKINNNKKEQ